MHGFDQLTFKASCSQSTTREDEGHGPTCAPDPPPPAAEWPGGLLHLPLGAAHHLAAGGGDGRGLVRRLPRHHLLYIRVNLVGRQFARFGFLNLTFNTF